MAILFEVLEVSTALFYFAVGSVVNFSSCIRAYPFLLAFVVLSVVGLGVGLIKRIIRL